MWRRERVRTASNRSCEAVVFQTFNSMVMRVRQHLKDFSLNSSKYTNRNRHLCEGSLVRSTPIRTCVRHFRHHFFSRILKTKKKTYLIFSKQMSLCFTKEMKRREKYESVDFVSRSRARFGQYRETTGGDVAEITKLVLKM